MTEVHIEITTTATHYVTLLEGETIEDIKNRESDIYLHAAGEKGWTEKVDIGGSSEIKILEVTQTIDNDEHDIFVNCPHCDHCEQHPIDEQRHHIQTFDLEWLDEENNIEVSLMKCHVCKQDFKMYWKYDENCTNPIL